MARPPRAAHERLITARLYGVSVQCPSCGDFMQDADWSMSCENEDCDLHGRRFETPRVELVPVGRPEPKETVEATTRVEINKLSLYCPRCGGTMYNYGGDTACCESSDCNMRGHRYVVPIALELVLKAGVDKLEGEAESTGG